MKIMIDMEENGVKTQGFVSGAVGLTQRQKAELFGVISDYAYALDTLDSYDNQTVCISHTTSEELFRMTYEGAMEVIGALKGKFGGLPMKKMSRSEAALGKYIRRLMVWTFTHR